MGDRQGTGDVKSRTYDGTITIGAFKKEKEQLEIDLIGLIGNRVKMFKEETGYAPSAIGVVMTDLTSLEDRHRDFCVGNVHVSIEI